MRWLDCGGERTQIVRMDWRLAKVVHRTVRIRLEGWEAGHDWPGVAAILAAFLQLPSALFGLPLASLTATAVVTKRF